MPAGVHWRTDPFSATGGGDGGQVLTCCRAHLLKLVQDVCSRLLEKWPPLFSHLNSAGQVNGAGDVWHFADYVQGRFFAAHWLKVETERLRQRQLRYSQVILSGNQLRKLVIVRYLGLQYVESRNCSRFKTI